MTSTGMAWSSKSWVVDGKILTPARVHGEAIERAAARRAAGAARPRSPRDLGHYRVQAAARPRGDRGDSRGGGGECSSRFTSEA